MSTSRRQAALLYPQRPDGRISKDAKTMTEIEESEISLMRPSVVTIRTAKPRDLPELKEMITLLAAHHGDAAGTTAE
ncbi:GNAT family N-acetyltransferase, partial [Rhizobium ruizarguesonis]